MTAQPSEHCHDSISRSLRGTTKVYIMRTLARVLSRSRASLPNSLNLVHFHNSFLYLKLKLRPPGVECGLACEQARFGLQLINFCGQVNPSLRHSEFLVVRQGSALGTFGQFSSGTPSPTSPDHGLSVCRTGPILEYFGVVVGQIS